MKVSALLYSLIFTIVTFFIIAESVDESNSFASSAVRVELNQLRTGDILLYSTCPVLRTMQMSPFSHAGVCVRNRKGIPYCLEIGPEHGGYLTLTPVVNGKALAVRQISKEIKLRAALQFIVLVRNVKYKLPVLKAGFCLRLSDDDIFCSTLVSSFFIFNGVFPATSLNLLPKDFASKVLPTCRDYSFGPLVPLQIMHSSPGVCTGNKTDQTKLQG